VEGGVELDLVPSCTQLQSGVQNQALSAAEAQVRVDERDSHSREKEK